MRTGSYRELCSEKHEKNERKNTQAQTADHFFSSKEAALTVKRFRKFEVGSFDDTSMVTLVRLDTIIDDAVDDFCKSIVITKEIHHSKRKNLEAERPSLKYENDLKNARLKT